MRSVLADNQYAWFGGILGCLAAFAVVGAFATVSGFAGLFPRRYHGRR